MTQNYSEEARQGKTSMLSQCSIALTFLRHKDHKSEACLSCTWWHATQKKNATINQWIYWCTSFQEMPSSTQSEKHGYSILFTRQKYQFFAMLLTTYCSLKFIDFSLCLQCKTLSTRFVREWLKWSTILSGCSSHKKKTGTSVMPLLGCKDLTMGTLKLRLMTS